MYVTIWEGTSTMDIGFETIGNATLIVYDNGPVLVTDPWVQGPAYFGSWTFQHEIPAEQLDAISKCRLVWFSHGHPDHMNPGSMSLFRGKTITAAAGSLKGSGKTALTSRS
jgi:L-ascorbate metabolism protein UlaG (beta-lactamase superfamily)